MSQKDNSRDERRKFSRVMAPVFYRSPSLFARRRQIRNVSLGGVCIYSDEPLEIGKRLEIEFLLPNKLTIVGLAKVVWIKELQADSDALYDIGLEFIDLPDKAMEELKGVLEENDRQVNKD